MVDESRCCRLVRGVVLHWNSSGGVPLIWCGCSLRLLGWERERAGVDLCNGRIIILPTGRLLKRVGD